jgi:mRNA interferase MazF
MVRGDIHEIADRDAVGHEQTGQRFCVILQSSHLLPSSTVLVAPTSASAPEKSAGRGSRAQDHSVGRAHEGC